MISDQPDAALGQPGLEDPRPEVDKATLTLPPTPVPAPSPSAATLCPPSAADQAATFDSRSIPGYELLGELGRGGMGVVYKARQTKLGRFVALKMILAGGHAGASELARFRTEGQAIARLQHPNIVQVFEVGEHEGRPFFSLEFCGGGSLERRLNGTPLPFQEAARLIETLARALDTAHRQRIIHRDLKPANVLLLDDGAPKITDFGLAKKLDGSMPGGAGVSALGSLTVSGSIMGTPSYMAPEQAGGKSKEIGPACDIYSLGAILYECLTGRPPFKAATPLETVLQVVADEPVPPTRLQSRTPRDLETICLKCLRKEPTRRYETAEALADDLRRFLEGRPIVARPVGRIERATKWVRRNPVLAGAAVVVTAALLVGTGVSTYFGIDASRQAGRARINETIARDNEADALAARNELARANESLIQTAADLQRSRDDLETTMARSWLRPLALRGGDEPMSDGEWEALWELATIRRGRLSVRFVEEALRTPSASRQLRDRASLALPAAVGLDPQRRAEVESLLLARMDDPTLGDEQKTDLAVAASAWDGLGSPAAVRMAHQLSAALTNAGEPAAVAQETAGLIALASRMDARDSPNAAAAVLRAMKDPRASDNYASLAQGLLALADRMEARDAAAVVAQAAAVIIQGMKDSKEPNALYSLVPGLTALADRLDAKVATQAAAMIVQVMKENKDPSVLYTGASALPPLGARQNAEEAASITAQAAAILLQAMKDTKEPNALNSLAPALAVLTPRLDARESGEAASKLIQFMKETKEPNALNVLGPALTALAGRLDVGEVSQTARTLIQFMKDTKDPNAFSVLIPVLSAVAVRLDAREADQAAAALIQLMKGTKDPGALYVLATELSAVAPRMPAKDAAAVIAEGAGILLQNMKDAKEPNALNSLAPGLSALAAQMDARDADQAAATYLQLMKEAKEVNALNSLAPTFSAVAARLDARDAARSAATIIQVMKDTKDPSILYYLTTVLPALEGRLNAEDAAALTAQAVDILLQTMTESKEPIALQWAAPALATLADRMDARAAARAAAAIVLLMKDANSVNLLSTGLTALAARLDAREAAQDAATLLEYMKDTKDANAVITLASMVSTLAARLDAKEAAQSVTTLIQFMKESKLPNIVATLAPPLSALSGRLDAREAAQAAANLLQVMKDTRDPGSLAINNLTILAPSLSALAARMDASEAAAILVQAMKGSKDPSALGWLAQGLSEAAVRLEPRQAAAILVQAVKDTRDRNRLPLVAGGVPGGVDGSGVGPNVLQALAQGLLTMAARMEPGEAAQAATVFMQTMKDPDSRDQDALERLADTLSALLSPLPVAEIPSRSATVATAAISAGGGPSLGAIALLLPAAKLPPCRLSAQQVVQMLKMPTCIGPLRRVVLEQLGSLCQRSFSDAWEFVRFAQENNLDVDLATPPQRLEADTTTAARP